MPTICGPARAVGEHRGHHAWRPRSPRDHYRDRAESCGAGRGLDQAAVRGDQSGLEHDRLARSAGPGDRRRRRASRPQAALCVRRERDGDGGATRPARGRSRSICPPGSGQRARLVPHPGAAAASVRSAAPACRSGIEGSPGCGLLPSHGSEPGRRARRPPGRGPSAGGLPSLGCAGRGHPEPSAARRR